MSLRIFNTLTRQIEPFSSLEPGHVRMYVCGMTVYDLCHLGHARSMMAFDVVRRWLEASGYRVTHVRNVTDIDDKIIKRALENGEPIRALTSRMIDALHQDADALGMLRPTLEPHATDHVPAMLALIERLQARVWPTRGATATCTMRCASLPATASSAANRWTNCARASVWR